MYVHANTRAIPLPFLVSRLVAKCNANPTRNKIQQTFNTLISQLMYNPSLPSWVQPNYGPAGGSPKDRARQRAQSYRSSSWVEMLGWDELTQTLAAKLRNRWYYWQGPLVHVYIAWARGIGVCRTNDPTGRNRWYIGKAPSLGAAFHSIKQQLVGRRI